MDANFVERMFEAFEILGEEAFEEFFEEMASIFSYVLNSIIYNNDEGLMND